MNPKPVEIIDDSPKGPMAVVGPPPLPPKPKTSLRIRQHSGKRESHQQPPRCLRERCPGLGSSGRSSCPAGTPSPSQARTPSKPQWRFLRSAPEESHSTENLRRTFQTLPENMDVFWCQIGPLYCRGVLYL